MPKEVIRENKRCHHCKGKMASYDPKECLIKPQICGGCLSFVIVNMADGTFVPRYYDEDGSYIVGMANV